MTRSQTTIPFHNLTFHDDLDMQPIDQAARACEMLGVILTVGAHVKPKLLSHHEWNEAGQVGFEYAQHGEDGVESALRLVKDRFDKTNLNGGPAKVFGCFYDWLRFNKVGKSSGSVRAVVRKFILSNFPVDNGADVLGETVVDEALGRLFVRDEVARF